MTGYWFEDLFDDLAEWEQWTGGTGAISITGGILNLRGSTSDDEAGIWREDSRQVPESFNLMIRAKATAGYTVADGWWTVMIYTGTQTLEVRFLPNWGQIFIRNPDQGPYWYTADMQGIWITWLFKVSGNKLSIYRDGVIEIEDITMFPEAWPVTELDLLISDEIDAYFDYYRIEDTT